ncbi:MAG: hypothetical protein F4Y99_13760 [Acidimicrobiaceae bacterium]|nr:hypothetical protein [Acidimicrobiaceae bacterium]MYF44074.1 hypothetical protein [Acidimicrobiaceae bacterium]
MLVLLAAEGARLDAGAVGLALARRRSEAGEQALFVDADTTGSRLARRLGEVAHADYSPAARGLPSLMVARQPMTLRLLAEHCYSLDAGAGSLWALFAPFHPDGGEHAAAWLAEQTGELASVDRERSVIVASSFPAGARRLAPAVQAGAVLVLLAPVESVEAAEALGALCRGFDLSGRRCPHRALIVEGDCPLGDDEVGAATGMHVAGRVPVVDEERMLRLGGGRRDRALVRSVDEIAGRLLSYSRLVASQLATHRVTEAPATQVEALGALEGPTEVTNVNGAPTEAARRGGQVVEATDERRG